MKTRFLLMAGILALMTFIACEMQETFDSNADHGTAVDTRSANTTLCHLNDAGEYVPLTVNENAVNGHLDHGDYLPDADGDGYSAEGACIGSADDCDDADPDVNPGAEEICGDRIDNNCNGEVDEGCEPITCPCFTAEELQTAYESEEWVNTTYWVDVNNGEQEFSRITFEDLEDIGSNPWQFQSSHKFEDLHDIDHFDCFNNDDRDFDPSIINNDITEAEYDACRAIIRAFLEANCSLGEGESGKGVCP
jgi:hypothetical protein